MTGSTLLRTLTEKVDPRHAAVVVVDVQNDFCADEGFFGKLGFDLGMIQEAAQRTTDFVEQARGAGVPVVFIRSTYDDHYQNDPFRERSSRRDFGTRCISGTWGADFYSLRPLPDEPIVTKHRYSGFQNTDLDVILRAWNTKTLIMTGVTTNVCVESTAREGYFRGYYIVFLSDCTGTTNEDREDLTSADLQQWTLTNIDLTFGIVSTSSEVAESWLDLGALMPSK